MEEFSYHKDDKGSIRCTKDKFPRISENKNLISVSNTCTMKYKLLLTAIAVFLFSRQAMTQSQPAHRVLLQISSNDTLAWKGLMNNVKNLKLTWGDSVQIEVIAQGMGVDLLTKGKTNQQEKINQYKQNGVVFVACESTMIDRKIPHENIIPEAGFVKSAVVELVKKQEQGWTYFKAGF